MSPILPEKSRQKKTDNKSRLLFLKEYFDKFEENGTGYKACCPAHDDRNPSLSINEGEDGRILIRCHAGCPTGLLLEVVGLSYRDLMPGARRIVATYDYQDEQGELLYQSVRYYPKDFRQRQPKEGGGWIWSTKEVPRVLYRLPELLETDPKRPVLIVEGEKDVDRLWDVGFVATCNVGGAGKWREEYNDALDCRQVTLIPDNDPAGWDHARHVGSQLHGVADEVKLLDLPNLPDGGDVSDWLDNGGRIPTLRGLVLRAPDFDPSTQRPIGSKKRKYSKGKDPSGSKKTRKAGKIHGGLPDGLDPTPTNPIPDGPMGRVSVEPFPTDALPQLLGGYIESIAEALPCPVDFPGTMLLPVLGAFIGRRRCIEIKPSWREYPLLWTACVARSGDRKSPAFEKITEPIKVRQRVLYARYLEAMERYKEELKEKEEVGEPPILEQILTTDTTIEALKVVLANNPNGIICPSDELSGWVRAHGQYKGGHGDDRQIWLSIWSSSQIVTNRKTDPLPIIVNDPFVCITGSIQPDALPDIVGDSREDGLSARFLYCYPDPIPYSGWTEDVVESSQQYHGICEQLWDMEPSEKPVSFSKAAKALWVQWIDVHRVESPPDNLRPTWSKAEGYCARIALTLHLTRMLCNETRSEQVDEESIAGATRLIDYFKGHARRVFSQASMASDQGRIAKALRWIRKQGGEVTARLAAMNGHTRDSNEAKKLFHDLEELGHGTVTQGKQANVTFTLGDKGPN